MSHFKHLFTLKVFKIEVFFVYNDGSTFIVESNCRNTPAITRGRFVSDLSGQNLYRIFMDFTETDFFALNHTEWTCLIKN